MSFTKEEQRLWHAARRVGINPDDYHPDDLSDAVMQQEADNAAHRDDDDSSVVSLSKCTQCGDDLGSPSTAEFPLCDACEGS